MTVTAVEFDDLELWVCGYLRPLLAAWSAVVDRRFPAAGWAPGFAVVVRDDSGPDLALVTARRSLGVTVIGPETRYADTSRLAQRIAYLLRTSLIPGPSSPVAACAVRGPYSLDATGRAEFYLSADLTVVGRPIQ